MLGGMREGLLDRLYAIIVETEQLAETAAVGVAFGFA